MVLHSPLLLFQLFHIDSKSTDLLLHRFNAVPSSTQSLLPQTDFVITSANSEDVAAEGPGAAPGYGVEGKGCGCPVA